MQQNLGQAQTKTEQKIVSIYFVKKTGAAESLVETTKKFLSLFVLLQHTTATSFQRKKTICKKREKKVVSVVSLHVFTSIILFRLATFN